MSQVLGYIIAKDSNLFSWKNMPLISRNKFPYLSELFIIKAMETISIYATHIIEMFKVTCLFY